mmetsp:Transcript_6018/g.11692  ORF Transcript_6018/g.11692 Transcript_6018/m.11692 type:complete len:87 (+) Transcript_6018:1444-1704(+)
MLRREFSRCSDFRKVELFNMLPCDVERAPVNDEKDEFDKELEKESAEDSERRKIVAFPSEDNCATWWSSSLLLLLPLKAELDAMVR